MMISGVKVIVLVVSILLGVVLYDCGWDASWEEILNHGLHLGWMLANLGLSWLEFFGLFIYQVFVSESHVVLSVREFLVLVTILYLLYCLGWWLFCGYIKCDSILTFFDFPTWYLLSSMAGALQKSYNKWGLLVGGFIPFIVPVYMAIQFFNTYMAFSLPLSYLWAFYGGLCVFWGIVPHFNYSSEKERLMFSLFVTIGMFVFSGFLFCLFITIVFI